MGNYEILTKDNYVSNHYFMSYSTYSNYTRCEAAAAAHYRTPSTDAQLIGSYVDAHFSNEKSEFMLSHPEIINSKTGELKAGFKKAEDLIYRIENDETFMYYMSGEKQVIMTGKIAGYPFKIKIDSFMPDKFIVDLKVLKDFCKVWSNAFNSYVSFIEAYDYDIEMAIFQEIVYQNTGKRLPCYLACITKEEPSDIGIFEISQDKLDRALQLVKNNLPRIIDIREGKIAPQRCESCSYCRATKKARVLSSDYVGFNGDKLREVGIECNDPIVREKEE